MLQETKCPGDDWNRDWKCGFRCRASELFLSHISQWKVGTRWGLLCCRRDTERPKKKQLCPSKRSFYFQTCRSCVCAERRSSRSCLKHSEIGRETRRFERSKQRNQNWTCFRNESEWLYFSLESESEKEWKRKEIKAKKPNTVSLVVFVCMWQSLCAGMEKISEHVRRASVVHGDVAEQIRHGLSVVDAADGFGQDHAHVHRFDFGTLQFLQVMGHGVGHHHLRVQSHICITVLRDAVLLCLRIVLKPAPGWNTRTEGENKDTRSQEGTRA